MISGRKNPYSASLQKPQVLISGCLMGKDFRYDGEIIYSCAVEMLTRHLHLIPICPEIEIGLSSPRPPIKLLKRGDERFLFQPASGRFMQREIRAISLHHLRRNQNLAGLILKEKSPSCGPDECKYFHPGDDVPAGRTAGILPRLAARHRPYLPLISEIEINDGKRLFYFLVRLGALHAWQKLRANFSVAALQRFQADYKLLLLGFNPEATDKMGRLIAEQKKYDRSRLLREYRNMLMECLNGQLSPSRWKNVILHGYGHLSGQISESEKKNFMELLDDFVEGKAHWTAIHDQLLELAEIYDNEYLRSQKFLRPVPRRLKEDMRECGIYIDPFSKR